MMQSLNRILPYAENDKFHVVSIPYLNKQYEFILILPKNEPKVGYKNLKKLTFERLNNDLLSQLKYQKVDLKIPKFTLESKIKLNDAFTDLGMKMAFTDLAECADTKVRYFINSIFQMAKIVVDEKGGDLAPQAAPVMKCACACCCFQPLAPQIYADHPFAFLIRNAKTGTIILNGFVKDPSL